MLVKKGQQLYLLGNDWDKYNSIPTCDAGENDQAHIYLYKSLDSVTEMVGSGDIELPDEKDTECQSIIILEVKGFLKVANKAVVSEIKTK